MKKAMSRVIKITEKDYKWLKKEKAMLDLPIKAIVHNMIEVYIKVKRWADND